MNLTRHGFNGLTQINELTEGLTKTNLMFAFRCLTVAAILAMVAAADCAEVDFTVG